MKKIALLTSGGDAPGMNAAIRAIVLSCEYNNLSCLGFYHGYNGLIEDDFIPLSSQLVNAEIKNGGTLLKSARCPAMMTETGVKQACNTLLKNDIDCLIVIGGDGSFHGLLAIKAHWQGQVIGLPGTIDNDLYGCDKTIGFATAVNTATQAIDKIRDTANAFDRAFIVEVMGRHSGHIAFQVGLSCGAESIFSFENYNNENHREILKDLIAKIQTQQLNRKASYLVVLAENLWPGGASALQEQLKAQGDIESAICILGHTQRRGAPVPEDRVLATQLGLKAVDSALSGDDNIMLGLSANQLAKTDLNEAVSKNKPVDDEFITAHKGPLTHYLK
ncbi:ATP-dependent 6-phosphofructokinase [Pseudoalteromonas phenolica]|uniref:6-phosphofructokinase n=1 Tax=Pseudoalteromonas phenolica TaxID=161398 RepID=A0A0S2JZ96_9GAMM|nr:ATP-dependent 6-phosphofructokinase [Pseudoalteromonas phenolica]ALO41511.1 6-phosphofructokinase [Pseudoalteromonas phenolica]MBE0353943.1 6-phosphofructokinase 1 [Pseudoalteromonas phenolica O-BC30]RXF03232.1 ATP-dependent 6-phosphofructokinase [Pseudoalteromonas phenolica O-BC30]